MSNTVENERHIELDLSAHQWEILAATAAAEGAIGATILENYLSDAPGKSRFYRNARELGELGLIRIRREPGNKRANVYQVTDEGRRALSGRVHGLAAGLRMGGDR